MKLTPIELRHTLHKYPEIAFQEFRTTELIMESIKSIPGSEKLTFHTPFPTGVLIEYKVNDGPFLIFRADIDALPVEEENDIEFRSTNEYMHACGHDVHTSILYSFLIYVLENKPDQNILFLYQPAEEAGGGAMEFYNTGIFDQFKISNAFALHVTDEYKINTVASTPGVLFASALEIDIEFMGESAHVAFPDEGKNAFSAMRKFLDKSDELLSESGGSILFGIGKFNAGDVRNITPGYSKLEGSIRGKSGGAVTEFLEMIKSILEEIKTATGVSYKITTGAHYPEVIVDENLYQKLKPVLSKKFNFIDCGSKMTGEDFGFFSKKWPSFMFWLGTSKGERYGLHNPKFFPHDDIIEKGKTVFTTILKSL